MEEKNPFLKYWEFKREKTAIGKVIMPLEAEQVNPVPGSPR